MKDWGESVSELMIGGRDNYKKLYAVRSYLGAFNFYTCILICLVCIIANFRLSCVQLLLIGRVYCCSCLVCIVVILCVFVVLCVHCCFFALDAGLLARSQYSEGPVTCHLDRGFSWFFCT